MKRFFPVGIVRQCWAALLVLAFFASTVLAAGSGENVLLIINPDSPSSRYIGNYYKNARNIPDANVIYWKTNTGYSDFANQSLDALFGMLANRGIADHVDYVIIP